MINQLFSLKPQHTSQLCFSETKNLYKLIMEL